jgi:germination protein M
VSPAQPEGARPRRPGRELLGRVFRLLWRGPLRRRGFWGFLLVLALVAALVGLGTRGEALVLWWEDLRTGEIGEEEVPAEAGAGVTVLSSGQTREVLLFFERQDNQLLGPEAATIYEVAELSVRAKQVVELLIQGPRSQDHAPTIPPGTTLRELFVTEGGTAYVDLSLEMARRHPGGATAELNSVYSIVNSLAHNFREIRRVQVLIQGREVETLSGHLALSRPLRLDYGLVDARLPAEGPPGAQARLPGAGP